MNDGMPRSNCDYKRRGRSKKAAKQEKQEQSRQRKLDASNGHKEKEAAMNADKTKTQDFKGKKSSSPDYSNLPTDRDGQRDYLHGLWEGKTL
jgi:hypothetical protein